MNFEDCERWVSLLIEKGDALRAAGVLRLTLGDLQVELMPAVSPEPGGTGDFEDGMFVDPLDDPSSFSSGRVPRIGRSR